MNNCITCGKEISKYALRCSSCSKRKEFRLEYSRLNFSNYCINCGKKISKYSQKCHACTHKGENNPRYNKERHFPNYCIDCKKEISKFAKRCYSCANKKDKNPSFKRGKPKCLDCGKEISYMFERCSSCAMKGDKNPNFGKHKLYTEKSKEKMSKSALLRVQTQHGPYKNTKPELKMKEILNELNISFEHQFLLGNHTFDFHILNTNILVEVDGDYYHSNPQKFSKLNKYQLKQKEKDLKNEQLAKDKGFILLRFWENDILNNKDFVIKKIIWAMKEFENAYSFNVIR